MFACRTTSKSNRVRKGEGVGDFIFPNPLHACIPDDASENLSRSCQTTFGSTATEQRAPRNSEFGIAEWIVFHPRFRGKGARMQTNS